MSEEKDKNTPPPAVDPEKEKKTKITVDVSRSPEIDSLHEELEKTKLELEGLKKGQEDEKKKLLDDKAKIEAELVEKKAILEKQALDALEKEKTEIMELAKKGNLTEDQITEIEGMLSDVNKVSTAKTLITMMVSVKEEKDKIPPTKTPPMGKAQITPPPKEGGEDEFENPRALIDELYRRAYYATKEYTVEQVADAKAKIDTLIKSLIEGRAWKQLKAGERLPAYKMMACPHCKGTIIGEVPEKCPYCKFSFAKTGDIGD